VALLCHPSQRRGGPCEVWATIVFYISLWHGLSAPDKLKNIFKILECIWNMKEKNPNLFKIQQRASETEVLRQVTTCQ